MRSILKLSTTEAYLTVALSITTAFTVVTLGLTAYVSISRALLYNAAQNSVPAYVERLK